MVSETSEGDCEGAVAHQRQCDQRDVHDAGLHAEDQQHPAQRLGGDGGIGGPAGQAERAERPGAAGCVKTKSLRQARARKSPPSEILRIRAAMAMALAEPRPGTAERSVFWPFPRGAPCCRRLVDKRHFRLSGKERSVPFLE